MGIKYNYKDVSKIVDDLGYCLLSNEYINARTKLNIREADVYQVFAKPNKCKGKQKMEKLLMKR